MKTFFLSAIGGTVCIILGSVLGYIYIEELDTHNNIIYLLVGLAFASVGAFLLRKAGKSAYPSVKLNPDTEVTQAGEAAFEEKLKKNNEMLSAWSKTIKTRDQLKVLQISAAAKEQAS